MADISKIQLPNGTAYNIKDDKALPLTGGSVTGPVSFGDSVSIDEATVGDLVVNGNASFTNNIQANTINGVTVGSNPKFTDTNTVTTATTTGSGNAVTAITASNGALTVTKGSTFLTSLPSHNHNQIITVGDQRSTATTPNSYSNALIFQGLKNKTTIGSPSNDTYSYLIGLRGWSDSSGGSSHEIAFNDTGVFIRRGATTTWGSWEQLYTTGNKPTASDVGLGNVENKSSATIRGELTSSNVTTALGYTPYNSTNPNGYTTNTGTVTKVTAGTGLSIGSTSGGNFTTTGTINHTNSVTAQTTQAVYPIKIDAQGHISAYGSAVTIPTVNNATLTIQKNGTTVKTFTANASSDVTANITVPTKVSELTNDSGYITSYTDTNTHRPIQMNGTQILGDNTTALNLKAGTGITLANSSGTVTITNSSTNTDTKVTSVDNHYAPSADTSAALSVDASSTTAATWNSTSLVTGVNLQRDAKGHVVGVTVDSIKMPANPNTNLVTSVNSKTGAVSLTASDVGAAASSHAHGNITSGGDITATAPTIASGDQLVINDSSASKITNGPTFDGSTTTTALSQKGTWESFSKVQLVRW